VTVAGSSWTSIVWKSVENAVATIAVPFDATVPLKNAACISGGIVVVERGENSCGTKALHAEQAGAEAVLIVNNGRHKSTMADTADGLKVTIPVYLVNRDDGMKLVNVLTAQPTTAVSLTPPAPRRKIAVCFCGPPGLGSMLREVTEELGTDLDFWSHSQ
jgi:hypothetical protein